MEPSPEDRLDSWKEIATYLKRDITTVQRWERREGMPVHRHLHQKSGSVFAFRRELDAWWRSRHLAAPDSKTPTEPEPPVDADATTGPATAAGRRFRRTWLAIGAAVLLAAGLAGWRFSSRPSSTNPLEGARFQQLTDFGGAEQAAALSPDGRFVAFLSDRDGRMDVWITQVGTAQFYNLTRGGAPELVNPSVRTIGFSPDSALVTFWARRPYGVADADIGIWAVPVLGGSPRPYLEGVAEFDWSRDASQLVYHTPGPGDPMFVRARDGAARQIFSASPGLHAHFPAWSPDRSFIYFVQGTVPDRLDMWRIRPTGGTPERMTSHASRVSHPVFIDDDTLLYLATDADGSGPWLHALDVGHRSSRRLSSGVDRYTSLAASNDGRSLAATVSRPSSSLWRIPMVGTRIDTTAAERIPLNTRSGFSPRVGPGFLVYVSSRGESDALWKWQNGAGAELWTATATRIATPAISPTGDRVAFVATRAGQSSLMVVNADGTNAHVIAAGFPLQGAPAWMPDGRAITIGSTRDGTARLYNVSLDGTAPRPVASDTALDPAWSADGTLLAYSGPDIGTTFEAKIASGQAPGTPLRRLTLSRGARHMVFLPGARALIALRGDIVRKDLWLIDVDSGSERQLTQFPPGFDVRDFDLSPDGRELVVERVQEQSDIVLIDRQ